MTAACPVIAFARESGELHSLSTVDIKVIALAHTLELAAHGHANLRSAPPPPKVHSKASVNVKKLPGWGEEGAEWDALDQAIQDSQPLPGALSILQFRPFVSQVSSDNSHLILHKVGRCPVEQHRFAMPAQVRARYHPRSRRCIWMRAIVLRSRLMGGALQRGLNQSRAGRRSRMGNGRWLLPALMRLAGANASTPGTWRAWRGTGRQEQTVNLLTARKETVMMMPHQQRMVSCHPRNTCLLHPCWQTVHYAGRLENETLLELCGIGAHDDEGGKASSEASKGDSEDGEASQSGNNEEDESETDERGQGEPSTSSVVCVTGDFAMQNVILQMGLRLASPDGRIIQQTRRWALRCTACFQVSKVANCIHFPPTSSTSHARNAPPSQIAQTWKPWFCNVLNTH